TNETAERIDFSVQDRAADVIEPVRERSARDPFVGGRVVFQMVGPGEAQHAAADHMDFSADGCHRHLVERRRQRRLRRPATLRLGLSLGLRDGCPNAERRTDGSQMQKLRTHRIPPAFSVDVLQIQPFNSRIAICDSTSIPSALSLRQGMKVKLWPPYFLKMWAFSPEISSS